MGCLKPKSRHSTACEVKPLMVPWGNSQFGPSVKATRVREYPGTGQRAVTERKENTGSAGLDASFREGPRSGK